MKFGRNAKRWVPLPLLMGLVFTMSLPGASISGVVSTPSDTVASAPAPLPTQNQGIAPVAKTEMEGGSLSVLEAYPVISEAADNPMASTIGYHACLDDEIAVIARGFPQWLKKLIDSDELASPKNPDGTARDLTEQEIKSYAEKTCLFLNEEPYPDLHPRADSVTTFANSGTYQPTNDFYRFQFRLTKTALNKPQWIELFRGRGISARPVDVSIGFYHLDGRTSAPHMPSATNPTGAEAQAQPYEIFTLSPASGETLLVGFMGVAFIVVLCFVLALKTDFLRDVTCPLNPDGRLPYSLALCQLAFWTLIVSASYIFLAVLIGEFETISTAAVTLMGISSVTGLGAVMINHAQNSIGTNAYNAALWPKTKKDVLAQIAQLETTLQAADARIATAKTTLASGANPSIQTQLDALEIQKTAIEGNLNAYKNSLQYFNFFPAFTLFVMDLLQESNTVSFHRFQLMVWTGILGAVFGYKVFEDLAMPEFSSSLLILVGISSGTYVGFKFPAANPVPTVPTAQN